MPLSTKRVTYLLDQACLEAFISSFLHRPLRSSLAALTVALAVGEGNLLESNAAHQDTFNLMNIEDREDTSTAISQLYHLPGMRSVPDNFPVSRSSVPLLIGAQLTGYKLSS